MPIRVIVELQAQPGKRDELASLLERILGQLGPGARGYLGSERYAVLDNPDSLVEIAEWDSAEARQAHMEEAAATGAYAPLMEVLSVPPRAMVISPLP